MINVCKPFALGQVVATPKALAALEKAGEVGKTFLDLHANGNWGTIVAEDWAANDEALRTGERLLSAYRLRDNTKIWIVTEANRTATTILLPDEF